MRIVRTALAYSAAVFGAGFLLGTVRVLLVAPAVGERMAEVIEAPIMVAMSWGVASWIMRRATSVHGPGPTLAVGVIALGFLLAFEVAVGVVVFGQRPSDALLKHDPMRAAAYYGALVLFTVMPWVVSRRTPDGTARS